ncbi:MAG: MBL fold metallo-hydrolase [Thermoplasmatota archaeon]
MTYNDIEKAKIYTLIVNDSGYTQSLLYGLHGVSFLIDVETKKERKRILFDTGQSAEPILHNMKILGLDPQTIDMIFLSHCHYDHTKGLVGMLKAIKKDNIPIIAHPDIFRECMDLDSSIKIKGITNENSEKKIREEGGHLLLVDSPFSLMDGVISTGEIEDRYDFEDVSSNKYTIENGNIVEDRTPDDMSLILKFSNGIVVVSGCSHAGIVSIVRKAVKVTDKSNVKGVIGGFHLLNSNMERIETTKNKFQEFGVKKVYAGHCTGLRAESTFQKNWKENFEKLQCGKIFEFS